MLRHQLKRYNYQWDTVASNLVFSKPQLYEKNIEIVKYHINKLLYIVRRRKN